MGHDLVTVSNVNSAAFVAPLFRRLEAGMVLLDGHWLDGLLGQNIIYPCNDVT